MRHLKIVLIGAGSASFGSETITDILLEKRLQEFTVTLALVDTDEVALRRMWRFAQLLREYYRANHVTIEASSRRQEVLQGADFVIISVAQDRWEMWEGDFYIPLTFGFRQVYGENGGPGAAFHTLRSIHLVLPICEDIARLCPEALVFNYTNPESRVCLAIRKLTPLRIVGLCHGPVTTLEKVAEILERSPKELEVIIGGINHFHWVLGIRDRMGQDLMPEFHKKMEGGRVFLNSFVRTMYDLYGYLVYPAGSHPEEYIHFAYSLVGPLFPRWGIGRIARRPDATIEDREYILEDQTQQPSYELWCTHRSQMIEEVVAGRISLPEEFQLPSQELAIPMICDVALNERRQELAANVPNEGLAIENLPENAIVEVPVMVDGDGVHPIKVGSLPEAIAAMCRLQISIQELLVAAYRERSKKLLLQALLLEPVVDDVERARTMMELMLRLQAGYLPELY